VRHGFKAHAERLGADARESLGVAQNAALDPWAYAESLGVIVLELEELTLPETAMNQLLRVDNESWSGVTLKEGNTTFILVNPTHSNGRQASTLMHELAHLILGHMPARVDVSPGGLLLLSDYADDAEAEADWLSAAMLLPREALIQHRLRGRSVADIARSFGTSEQLCEWRLRMTGVDIQLRRRQR
jgi:Zn-dependent peptidase ImmA (M78 family)